MMLENLLKRNVPQFPLSKVGIIIELVPYVCHKTVPSKEKMINILLLWLCHVIKTLLFILAYSQSELWTITSWNPVQVNSELFRYHSFKCF